MFSNQKIFSRQTKPLVEYPDLIQIQKDSCRRFLDVELKELFRETFPITDYSEKELSLDIVDFWIDEPKISETQAKEKELTFESAIRAKARLTLLSTGEIKEQEVYLGDLPKMSPRGTFIINGVERVIIAQLLRSPGIYFMLREFRGEKLFSAKIIPYRGAWFEFNTESDNAIYVKIDRKRKIAATALLRAIGAEKDEEILEFFKELTEDQKKYIQKTLHKDPSKDKEEALIEIYRRLKPGDIATYDNALGFFTALLSPKRYDLSKIGRFKINQRLKKNDDLHNRIITLDDVVRALKEIVALNTNPKAEADDIDDLSNRRLRTVGELLENRFRLGLTRLAAAVQDRMTAVDLATVTPAQLINPRVLSSAIKEFFATFPLSQFMDQTNPLAELEHKRRLSATGPGGLTRERAGLEVRDVHPSHYGRICPVQTPEGQNIGLVSHLSLFARINDFGFLETPYLKVLDGHLTSHIDYLDAFKEKEYVIAQGTTQYNEKGEIIDDDIEARVYGKPGLVKNSEVHYIDVSPQQPFSVGTSLIPFLEHDDSTRALMGSNMQRQAVPPLKPEPPFVASGLEHRAAQDSGHLIFAEDDSRVISVSSDKIVVETKNKTRQTHQLLKFVRSNQGTVLNQKPAVQVGQEVKKGDLLADGSATAAGQLALGRNLLVAFMPWGGYNFEDAIIISERVLKEDYFSSIHIEEFACDVRDTKLGPETITADIPNVSEEKLKDLDGEGIVRIGAEVHGGDILVGKISPKGEIELSPEEKLLRVIFGEKAEEVKDTSLYLEHGRSGRVVSVRVLSRDRGDKLEPGISKRIIVSIAKLRKVTVGDKLAGRHGNKGVISRILPEEDTPYLGDGTPVDIILNPLGVISRTNIGQIFEAHLGWAAGKLGYQAVSPAFDGASLEQIKEELKKAGLPLSGKTMLYDGRTGKPFDHEVTVGNIYMMKLIHMVEDKVHARAVGPYSLITQQPLGGKAQYGGQRFGEMEVWALEGYGAASTLQEIITIKSDDVAGRSQTYNNIIKGETIKSPSIPAVFNVLSRELQGLGLSIDIKEGTLPTIVRPDTDRFRTENKEPQKEQREESMQPSKAIKGNK